MWLALDALLERDAASQVKHRTQKRTSKEINFCVDMALDVSCLLVVLYKSDLPTSDRFNSAPPDVLLSHLRGASVSRSVCF